MTDTLAPRHTYHVYELIDPRTGTGFYVGCTIQPKKRLSQHMCTPDGSTWAMCRAILNSGLRPVLTVIATFNDREEALDYEWEMIRAAAIRLRIANIRVPLPDDYFRRGKDQPKYNPIWIRSRQEDYLSKRGQP